MPPPFLLVRTCRSPTAHPIPSFSVNSVNATLPRSRRSAKTYSMLQSRQSTRPHRPVHDPLPFRINDDPPPATVAFKELTPSLNPLDAKFTKNRGRVAQTLACANFHLTPAANAEHTAPTAPPSTQNDRMGSGCRL